MDLSAIIFVVLALAWAVYLIPKALSHHDEMASDRLVEGHSDKVRILSRKRSVTVTETIVETADEVPAEVPAETGVETVAPVRAATPVPTRASARRAARNRRRVLTVLVAALAVVVVLAAFAVVPWWSTAVPGALVVAFLVVARLSVRRMQQARATRRTPLAQTSARTSAQTSVEAFAEPVVQHGTRTVSQPQVEAALEQLGEDTAGIDREQLEAALADDGSLWDPLPMTLPTYVNKARARRTVRTIELTGINSSGHDEGDSALARESAATTVATEPTSAEQRKVAGA